MQDKHSENDKGGYEVAERVTGLKRSTLYSAVHHKAIPHYRIGGRQVVFSARELEAWMAARRVAPNGGQP